MAINSKYFDSIRIKSGKKAASAPQKHQCQWAGCDQEGTHRAPAGRGREGQFLYFCVDHVREYNKNFNYFSGLDDEAVANLQKDALMTGERPTWKTSVDGTARTAAEFSQIRSGSAAYQNRMRDPFNMFGRARTHIRQRKLKPLEAKAFVTLELETSAKADDIKARYKELVKRHHPDANGGDRASEDRLRDILQAYNLLKTAGFC